MIYYSIPWVPDRANESFRKVDAEESVRQHVHLLLSTLPGSFRFAPLYGSWLNKHHFRLPDKRRGERRLEEELKEKLQKNLRLLLAKYEPRFLLKDLEVMVKFPKAEEIAPFQKGGRITFEVKLSGTIHGKETFQHLESILLR